MNVTFFLDNIQYGDSEYGGYVGRDPIQNGETMCVQLRLMPIYSSGAFVQYAPRTDTDIPKEKIKKYISYGDIIRPES